MIKNNRNRGFTLVELLVTIGFIGVLAVSVGLVVLLVLALCKFLAM